MKKKITFEIETESDDERIKVYLENWIKDNFQKTDKINIKIENTE